MKRLLSWLAPLIMVAALGTPAAAESVQPLVDAEWAATNISRPGVVFLDVRNAQDDYAKGHIPGAVHSSYTKGGWRVTDAKGIEGMLPPPEQIETLVGELGIDNASHVVVVAAGLSASDMSTATRVYWTFKVSGHDRVSILNGGMKAYANGQRPLQKDAGQRPAARFKATMRPGLVVTKDDVVNATRLGSPLVDIRSSDQYLGVNKPPAVKRYGTIPGAMSLPENWLTVDNGGVFRDRETLKRLAAAANVPLTGRLIAFCNSGQLGSLGWFVLSEILGNKDATLYDGSMIEWAADPALPIDRKLLTN
ncbi:MULTISPECIES: sulfurtransferase [Azospirillum]|uniref:Sulfurtransferase n=1 Tax=Azospirillum brasilense TaxID=192 RepID=A0A6L3B1Z3_AZOBR|nr:sulfurtransferase [Azospirillum brasilense]KAA0686089.1 sulfurtransferase [Azospirillum brasilense]